MRRFSIRQLIIKAVRVFLLVFTVTYIVYTFGRL